MTNPLPFIIFCAVTAALIIVLALHMRPKKNRERPRHTGRTNASDAGDTIAPLWFAGGASHHDYGSGGYSGGDSGGSDGGGGGGGE
jgi:hypothetical protein